MIRLGKRISKVQLFIVKSQVFDGYVTLFNDQFHYLVRVLRLKMGEKMDFVVENQTRLSVNVTDIRDNSIFFTLLDKQPIVETQSVLVTLAQGCPKQDKMSDIINMCSQAGLCELIPILTTRSIVDYSLSKQDQKVQRWKTVALDASRQSQRSSVVDISPILSFQDFSLLSESASWDLKLVLWEEAVEPLKSVLLKAPLTQCPLKVCMVVGPEGGLSVKEVDTLLGQGFVPVSLGSSILRTENAGFFALAQLLYHFS